MTRFVEGPEASHDVQVVTLLREVLGELRAIRVALETTHHAKKLSREDRERLARLLPVLGATFRGALLRLEK